VALTFLHLRKLGLINRLGLVATSHQKTIDSQEWLHEGIGKIYKNIPSKLDFMCPSVAKSIDRESCKKFPLVKSFSLLDKKAFDEFNPSGGCGVSIFTPDKTHFDIASYAVSKGNHVILAKPAVMSLHEHLNLAQLANEHQVLVCVEFHKRFRLNWDSYCLDLIPFMKMQEIKYLM
jgi:D-galacturonate reductase